MFTDANKTTYKSTYQLLKDISEIYDDLSDKQQAGLLEALAGKRQGQIVAATITNFKAAEKALQNMANSAGSAEAELATYQESAEYLFNQFKETFTSIAQHSVKRDDLKNLIKFGTSMLEIVDGIVSKIGLLPAILTTVVGIISSKKALQHNFLGFNVNDGKFGMNFLGAQVGKGWKQSVFGNTNEIKEAIKAVNDFHTAFQNGTMTQAQYNSALNHSSPIVRQYVQDIRNGTTESKAHITATKALNAELKNTGVSGKLASVGLKAAEFAAKALNTALSMITSLAISALLNALIRGIGDEINSINNHIDKISELTDKENSLKSEIENLNGELVNTKTRIAELEEMDKLSLLEQGELENLKEANDELERQIRLKRGELANTSYEKNEEAQQLWKEMTTDIADGTNRWWAAIPIVREIGNIGRAIKGEKTDWTDFVPLIGQTAEVVGEISDNVQHNKWWQQIADLEEYKEKLEEINEMKKSTGYIRGGGNARKEVEDAEAELKKLADKIQKYYNGSWTTLATGLDPALDENKEILAKVNQAMKDWDDLNKTVYKNFYELYNDAKFSVARKKLEELANAGELTAEKFAKFTEKDVVGINEFRKALEEIGITNFEEVCEEIIKSAQNAAGTIDDTAKEVKNFIEILEKLQDKIDDTVSKQEKLAEAFKKTGLGAKLSAEEAYDLYKNVPEIAKYLERDGKEFTISRDGYREANRKLYEDIQSDIISEREETKVQKSLLDQIISLYDEQLAFMDSHNGIQNGNIAQKYTDLINEYKTLYKVTDDDALGKNIKETLKEVEGKDEGLLAISQLMNDIFDEEQVVVDSINAGFDEAKSKVDDFNKDIKTLDSAIKTLNGDTLLSYDELNELLEIDHDLEYEAFDNGYSISIDTLEELRKKSYETRNDYIDDLMDAAKAELETAKTTKATYQEKCGYINEYGEFVSGTLSGIENAAEKMAAEEQVNIANAQISALEEVIKKLEALQGKITYDDDDKKLSDEMQNRIDYYNTITSAIEIMRDKYIEAFEKEKEALEGEKNALEEGKKALKEANDERDRELKLIEARNNLENAKKRKVWVYSEGEGFKQVADQKAIREAEEEYRDAITDVQEAEIDKKIDELDKKIEENERQQEAFEKSLEDMTNLEQNIEDAKTVEQAMAALGLTDEKDLLNLSDAVKEGIKNGLAEAIIEKDNEENKDKTDKNGNSLYTPVTLDDVLKSMGATVTAEDLNSMKSELPTEAVYNAAVKGFSDSLKEFTENAVNSSVVNNGGIVVSPTFNIYDASDPDNIAKVVNSEITNLLTRYNNSIK